MLEAEKNLEARKRKAKEARKRFYYERALAMFPGVSGITLDTADAVWIGFWAVNNGGGGDAVGH